MKRKVLLIVIALGVRVAYAQGIPPTVVEAKITNQTVDLLTYKNAQTRVTKVDRAPGKMPPGKSTIFRIVGSGEAGAVATFHFTNVDLDIDVQRTRQSLKCNSAAYACTFVSVRQDCGPKRCLFGYSITVNKK
jgi:hypothetical protein